MFTRRQRIPVAVAALIALFVLATSFPWSALLAQRSQLASTSARLHTLQNENRLLAEQQRQLNSTAEIDRLARQDYQMVLPGQTLYDVLPPSGHSTPTSAGTRAGDPGNQPLVAPANAPDMAPDPGLPQTSSPTGASGSPAGKSAGSGPASGGPGSSGGTTSAANGSAQSRSSFWSRVTDTLEFWK